MKLYNIAGMIISIDGYIDKTTLTRMSGYEIAPSDDGADVVINISLSDSPMAIPGENSVTVSPNEIWCVRDDMLSYYMCFPDIDGAAVRADCDVDFTTIGIKLYDVRTKLGYDDNCYLFNTLSTMLHYIALNHERLVFHSSSVCANGEGVAFSASSGVGKSTHTGLWLENIDGSFYINDDTPIIGFSDDRVVISGTPFAGTSGINTNITVPLRAIVFVTRGDVNSLTRVDTVTAFVRMMSQLKKPVNDIMSAKLIATLDRILGNVPCYLMECNISPEAAFTAYGAVFGND